MQPDHTKAGASGGPAWQGELLGRLRCDPRFRDRLHRVADWIDVPVSISEEWTCRVPYGARFVYFSTGTTGIPKRIAYSETDWEETALHRAECLAALGLDSSDTVAVVLSFGPWFSGDNITKAVLSLGARVLPVGLYAPHMPAALRLMARVQASAMITTPSIALTLAQLERPAGLRKLVLVGETLSPGLRAELRDRFQVEPRALFAASEAVLGHEDPREPGAFVWDPDRVHLEVLDEAGRILAVGTGELLVTRRYGEASPLLRYRLGDIVTLQQGTPWPRFWHLGRVGHAFTLATGVKVARAQLEAFLDILAAPIHVARFAVEHTPSRDCLTVTLGGTPPLPGAEEVKKHFLASSLDVGDAAACGYLDVRIRTFAAMATSPKRRLEIEERPWRY